MTDGCKKSISGKTESGIQFSVEYTESGSEEVVREYFELETMVKSIESVLSLRTRCKDNGDGLYVPSDNPGNQMKTLCLAAAASYPNVLPSDFIEETLEIPFNSYKVYAAAKKYDSSEFLTLGEDEEIQISLEGVQRVEELLDK